MPAARGARTSRPRVAGTGTTGASLATDHRGSYRQAVATALAGASATGGSSFAASCASEITTAPTSASAESDRRDHDVPGRSAERLVEEDDADEGC